MIVLLDTDVLTDFLKGKPAVVDWIRSLQSDDVIAISIISRIEILQGRFASVLKAANASELMTSIQRLERDVQVLNQFTTLTFDEESAGWLDSVRLAKWAVKMKRPDFMIAGIAKFHSVRLATRNLRDFRDVPGLKLVQPI